MLDLIFDSHFLSVEKLRNDSEMIFVAEATKIFLNNLKTYLGLSDLMQATL